MRIGLLSYMYAQSLPWGYAGAAVTMPAYRPYALTSRLHKQRLHVGGQDLSRCAHVLCWKSVGALSLSVSARARAGPAVWHAGVGPLAACLAMAHVTVPRLTPNTRGRPSVTSYA